MPMTPVLAVLFTLAALCALVALAQAARARAHWRSRRRLRAGHHVLWMLVFALLALLGGIAGTALLGYRRLTAEAPVATLESRALGPQRFALAIVLPDGTRRDVDITGDEWQLDARVIKWTPRAVMLGAPALYRLDRIGSRYRDIDRERSAPRSVIALAGERPLPDLWQLKRRFPQWLPWIDADYGSGAFLPLVDGGRYVVTLAAAGGLVARPADAATAQKIAAAGW